MAPIHQTAETRRDYANGFASAYRSLMERYDIANIYLRINKRGSNVS